MSLSLSLFPCYYPTTKNIGFPWSGEACLIQWSCSHPVRPTSSWDASLLLWHWIHPMSSGLIRWGRPHPMRLVSLFEAWINFWGWPHPMRQASSFVAGLTMSPAKFNFNSLQFFNILASQLQLGFTPLVARLRTLYQPVRCCLQHLIILGAVYWLHYW